MKKYTSIGELLLDYRELSDVSQTDLASKFDVDVRTILRWEKNQTLLKPDKEEEMVDITFIPYQVIRNLNAPVAIPTYYDFDIRKYALSSLTKELPDINSVKTRMNSVKTERMRTIKHESDLNEIIRCCLVQKHISKSINKELILKAVEFLPELNFILFDTSGFYSGHSVFLPISQDCYQKIKNKSITEDEISLDQIIDYKMEEKPVFYAYDINADCNENIIFIISAVLKFFKDFPNKNYTYASYASRHDTFELNELIGINLIWEDKILQNDLESKAAPRLYEGNFTEFLKN
ncbi:MAG: helix-turn-helix domain-containing protein [Flavobacteriaceae bacterium]|nr:helix-turn-helix domain-containing protein [Flavobacteriaceae bacterium]